MTYSERELEFTFAKNRGGATIRYDSFEHVQNSRGLSRLGFANPDIRYPDIRIYPLILWQPKIRIS